MVKLVVIDAKKTCIVQEKITSPMKIEKNHISNRCELCNKKVSLLGLKCRCNGLFCNSHRHSDAHDCTFDYKGAGKELLKKANPLVIPSKLCEF
jgi:predicted nucleic acid binding AN1-type Zn finger protein